jgi:hypothetical protein
VHLAACFFPKPENDTDTLTMTNLSPKEFGLAPRTVLEQIDQNTIAIVMNRKSRIIMADGKKILEKVQAIKSVRPALKVALKATAPICSKTIKFLEAEGIQLIPVNDV